MIVNDENESPENLNVQNRRNHNVIHDGCTYSRKRQLKAHTLYWCKYHRSQKCNAKLKITTTNIVTLLGGDHSDSCKLKNRRGAIIVNQDFTTIMEEMVEDLALSDLALRPRQIWDQVSTEMNRRSPLWSGLSDNRVMKMVRNIRAQANGGDIFRALEAPNMAMVKDSTQFFLQFNVTLPDQKTGKIERIVGYGNPWLFGLLNGRVQIYIDGTFRIVPHPFYQCLIIMVYDEQTDLYVPILYILMTAKTQILYYQALHYVICVSDWKLDPFSVTCDFEKALLSAVGEQFRGNTRINGCLFHWKQALRRKMKKLNIEDQYVSMAMHKNVIDVLTVIPRDEIVRKGIPYVRSILDQEDVEGREKWNSFWDYFTKFWCSSMDFIETWNIIDRNEEYYDLQNRTNNALERYNRRLNDVFPTAHPSLLLFVQTIEIEARYQFQRKQDATMGRIIAVPHQAVTINAVSAIYNTFEV